MKTAVITIIILILQPFSYAADECSETRKRLYHKLEKLLIKSENHISLSERDYANKKMSNLFQNILNNLDTNSISTLLTLNNELQKAPYYKKTLKNKYQDQQYNLQIMKILKINPDLSKLKKVSLSHVKTYNLIKKHLINTILSTITDNSTIKCGKDLTAASPPYNHPDLIKCVEKDFAGKIGNFWWIDSRDSFDQKLKIDICYYPNAKHVDLYDNTIHRFYQITAMSYCSTFNYYDFKFSRPDFSHTVRSLNDGGLFLTFTNLSRLQILKIYKVMLIRNSPKGIPDLNMCIK